MADQGVGDARGALHPRHLGGLEVHRYVNLLKQHCDPLDAVPHHLATDVIEVIVGAEHADRSHAIGLEDPEELARRVRRVDEQSLASLAIADEVGEVHHLAGHRVSGGKITATEQLAKVETIVIRHQAPPQSQGRSEHQRPRASVRARRP